MKFNSEKDTTYPFSKIEAKWQQFWDKNKTFKSIQDEKYPKEKRKYILDMFPYPSGDGLHVGHPEGYTATDILSRFYKMKGFNVLHPMGFDSFGLPAEIHALNNNSHPEPFTQKNIQRFKKQLKSIGFSYDWDREIHTHSPSYYKWTQYLFLKLFQKGLAYKKEVPIWFCPTLKATLANEEVHTNENGVTVSNQGGHEVFRKPLKQWILKITEYAESLLEGLDELDWPNSIKEMQKNWIGKSKGTLIDFDIKNSDFVQVFTTRADTLFGCSYLVLAPEHPLVLKLVSEDQKKEVLSYINTCMQKSELQRTSLQKEKTGVFLGAYAKNPINSELVPIWISDYVLYSYGTGAVMAVPAHDSRDFEFAKKYNLPIKQVVTDKDGNLFQECFTQKGYLINSQEFDGLFCYEAIEKITSKLSEMGKGKKQINYKLRDWIFSRQRFWGEPIPVLIEDENLEKYIPLEYDELPLTLPKVESYSQNETGESPLANIEEFVNMSKNNKNYKRETNTMPQWAGSCWYFLRFTDPFNENEFASKEALDYWLPVSIYIGGAEHAVLHLLYARFWCHVFYDLGLIPSKEPFTRLVNQGMITSFAYKNKDDQKLSEEEVYEKDGQFFQKTTNLQVERIITKMSKSLKNVVNPDDVIQEYGADTLRLHEMFLGPLSQSKPWDTKAIKGVFKFLNRVYKLKDKIIQKDISKIESLLNKTIKNVEADIEKLAFNTAISSMMIFVNAIYQEEGISKNSFKKLILILAPFAPHMCEELWEFLGQKESIYFAEFPNFEISKIIDDTFELVFQINGKIKSKITAKKGLNNQELEKLAFEDPKISAVLKDFKVKKIIVVKDKLVNIVI